MFEWQLALLEEKLGAQASEALGSWFSFKRLAHMPKVRIRQKENGHDCGVLSHSLITSYLITSYLRSHVSTKD